MCLSDFERMVEALKCPARSAVYNSAVRVHKKIQFVDTQFLLDVGCMSRALGVLLDSDLFLIHRCSYLDSRGIRGRQAYASMHFARGTMDAPQGHYYYFNPRGHRERLYMIPSRDIFDKCFAGDDSRDALTVCVPWEYPTNGILPFEKYEIPIVRSVEV